MGALNKDFYSKQTRNHLSIFIQHALLLFMSCVYMSRVMRKPAFCICQNKNADQLRDDREADQRLCFCYTDSKIPLLPKSEIQDSNHLLCLYSPVCVGPGRKPRRPVFSQRGSYNLTLESSFLILVGWRALDFDISTVSSSGIFSLKYPLGPKNDSMKNSRPSARPPNSRRFTE